LARISSANSEGSVRQVGYLERRSGSVPIRKVYAEARGRTLEGKFFSVHVEARRCLKRLKKSEDSEAAFRLANIAAISLVLEQRRLTPKIISILIHPERGDLGLCVKRAKPVSGSDNMDFEAFYERLRQTAMEYRILRNPYDDLPNVDSFLLEARVPSNLGIIDGRIVLIDVDQKCTSQDPRIRRSISVLLKRIENARKAQSSP